MGEPETFYTPTPDTFGDADMYRLYTSFAAELLQADLATLFPSDEELRHVTIELLAERYSVGEVEATPELVRHAIAEAEAVLHARRFR